jgi:hypothetical protein
MLPRSIVVFAPISTSSSAIDRRVRANLDVVFDDATADVRNLVMAAAAKNVTEAVGAKPRAGMHNDPPTDHHSGVCRDGRIQVTFRTHLHAGADDDMRVDHDIVLDPGTGANHRERRDADVRPQARVSSDHRGWMDPRRYPWRQVELRDQ